MIFSISGFDDGPHWDSALIEAPSEEEAKAILQARLTESEADHESYGPKHIDTVWSPQPQSEWRVLTLESPLQFILGAGCR